MTYLSSFWSTSLLATTDKPRNSKTTVTSASEDSSSLENTFPTHPAKAPRNTESTSRGSPEMLEEKTPLLDSLADDSASRNETRHPQASFFKRVVDALVETLKVIIATLTAPAHYLIACFYDQNGRFSATAPMYKFRRDIVEKQEETEPHPVNLPAISEDEEDKADENPRNKLQRRSSRFRRSIAAADSVPHPSTYLQTHASQESAGPAKDDSPARHTRSKSNLNQVAEDVEGSTPTRSTRIKIVNQDALRQRRLRHEPRDVTNSSLPPPAEEPLLTVSTIKSPTSSMSSLNPEQYTKIIAPPRPLVPRRQPSYTALNQPMSERPQKTLIIDLDETLIHSMAKGGRMSTGHMVEVKLDAPVGAANGIIGPQVPILYYVHKRPHCDEFLRKVSKWYNLIVFTASVQEYADPVIDWLELERKYFSARYYRQHCTYRSGAYIKDLSTVEPDLTKVMILDNSPLSYVFHEDNAIPIEGWISDPTDNDLLNLIPLLEGLQYTTDVRSLLALRLGEGKER